MKNPQVVLHTSLGDITLALDQENTPLTAHNFLEYVKSGHYDGTVFHRVIDGFMIQGGGFSSDMQQKSAQPPIKNEGKTAQKNKRGTLAMARTSDPHSASAQFFINLVDNDFLNFTAETDRGWGYCVFGKVTAGMEVVDKIGKVATGNRNQHQNVPVQDVVIRSAEIIADEADR